MVRPTKKLKITISKSFNGDWEAIRISSDDMVSVNLTLLAEQVELVDCRNKENEDGADAKV